LNLPFPSLLGFSLDFNLDHLLQDRVIAFVGVPAIEPLLQIVIGIVPFPYLDWLHVENL